MRNVVTTNWQVDILLRAVRDDYYLARNNLRRLNYCGLPPSSFDSVINPFVLK